MGCGTVFEVSGAGTPLSENPQTSDFNADGRSDILWQNTNGQAAIWLMNGTTPTTEALVGAESRHELADGRGRRFLWQPVLGHPVAEHRRRKS